MQFVRHLREQMAGSFVLHHKFTNRVMFHETLLYFMASVYVKVHRVLITNQL